MSKKAKLISALCLMGVGALALWGVQGVMHKTSSPEFCASCHSMSYPQQEWEGSSHFANAKGIRAECSDCHIPNEGWHYVKAKVTALKDLYFEAVGKIDNKAKYESHRAEMAQRVWDDMQANDSETCRSCHSFDAMELSQQSKLAKQTHTDAKANGQTCIDCHKGIVHFLPEQQHQGSNQSSAPQGNGLATATAQAFAVEMQKGHDKQGAEVRLMPFAELNEVKINGDLVQGVLQGWQQAGADSVVYAELGKRITVALVDDEAFRHAQVVQTKHDDVTDADWREVRFDVSLPAVKVTNDLAALNHYGSQLNQNNCSGCHAAISADHYTANQWIGVVNSMKDRTSMSKDEVRALTIYLQRNAKDMAKQ